MEKKGDRWLRLGDLAAHKVIVVRWVAASLTAYFHSEIELVRIFDAVTAA